MRKILLNITVFLAASIFAISANAQGKPFDPSQKCGDFFVKESSINKVIVGLWSNGYIAGISGEVKIVDAKINDDLMKELKSLCQKAPDENLVTIVEKYMQNANISKSSETEPFGSPLQGKQMLEEFLADAKNSKADLPSFLLSLKPEEKDIRAIYSEPLASKLIPYYDGLFNSVSSLKLEPEHSEIYYIPTTTAKLRSGDAVLAEFPGGYKSVVQYLLGDYTLVRFKFVKAGETSGFALDGLIFVNDRWVIMPEPWGAL